MRSEIAAQLALVDLVAQPVAPPEPEPAKPKKESLLISRSSRRITSKDRRKYAEEHGLTWHGFQPGGSGGSHRSACGENGIIVPDRDEITCMECSSIWDRWDKTYGPMPKSDEEPDES